VLLVKLVSAVKFEVSAIWKKEFRKHKNLVLIKSLLQIKKWIWI